MSLDTLKDHEMPRYGGQYAVVKFHLEELRKFDQAGVGYKERKSYKNGTT